MRDLKSYKRIWQSVLVGSMGICLIVMTFITIAKPAGTFYAKYLILLYVISLVIAGLSFFKLKDFFDTRFKVIFITGMVILMLPVAVIGLIMIGML